MTNNPLGLDGISFTEFTSPNPDKLSHLFFDFGFSKVAKQKNKNMHLFRQGRINFVLNSQPRSFAEQFQKQHGPSISAMGWRFNNPDRAYEMAISRGARACHDGDYVQDNGTRVPAIYGIGESLIYFIKKGSNLGFVPLQKPVIVKDKGFLVVDHLTNNVFKGTMNQWADFYKNIFGFTEVRYFDIKGEKTGLTSFALRSPCGQFCIPINEASESKSQINEYLEEYNGPGVQHLAFLTRDLLQSMRKLKGTSIQTLDIAPGYYSQAFARVPHVREDKKAIQDFNILIDGDHEGYLLQIFTKTLIGPIFIELIQRENHLSFGEGNFHALFESIERDQIKRGVL